MFELLLLLTLVQPPEPVRNPTHVQFTCVDHDLDTMHELDFLSVSEDGSQLFVQTILLGDPPANDEGNIDIALPVQPVAYGRYVVRVRASVGEMRSPDSEVSNVFQRGPFPPGQVEVK